jgi:phage terminase large subunit-like protein
LQPLVKNATIQFSKKHQTLLDQMKYFPKGAHDDGLDALQMAVELAQKATDKIGISFLEYDPATGESKMTTI